MVYHQGDVSNESYTHFSENDNISFELNKTLLKNKNLNNKVTSIAWRNLHYNVKQFPSFKNLKCSTKTILRSLNGSFATNSLNGLMGPSGSGKTSLLNVLSGKIIYELSDSTEIYTQTQSRPIVSYFIEQLVHETIISSLTVGEILSYAFDFKNGIGRDVSNYKKRHIESTLKQLLLETDIQNQLFSHCSGGQMKRIACAQELMSLVQPDFLFLDEITTGLDSFAAVEVVKCLSNLATNHHMTIITSIHSPSNEILQYFNQLYVLAKGVCIYSGPPQNLQNHLVDIQKLSKEQPIETLIRISCTDLHNPQLQQLANKTLYSESNHIYAQLPQLTHLPHGLPAQTKHFNFTDLYLQICRYSRVTFLSQYRIFLGQLLFFIGITFTFSSFFNQKMVVPNGCYARETNSSSACKNDFFQNLLLNENINYICLNRAVQAYIIMCTSTMLYSSLLKVFRNEHRNQWYSLSVFFCSTSLVSILQILCFSFVLTTTSYFAVSEHAIDGFTFNWFRFSHYLLCTFICLLLTQSFGQFVGAAVLEPFEIAIMLSTTLFTFVMMLDDFFFKTDELKHQVFVWASEMLNMKYVTRYLIYIFYGIDRCDQANEVSWVLEKNYVDPNKIWLYIIRVLATTLIFRLTTILFMYFKFNHFKHSKNSSKELKIVHQSLKTIPIDFGAKSSSVDMLSLVTKTISQSRSEDELEFQQFARNKIIIGWQNLTLYGCKSIYAIGGGSPTEQPILRNLNGNFRFGTLNALMGASGAGKTSLLKVLNGRCKTRLSEDSLFYLSKYTKIETAFITQEVSAHLMQGLTCRQLIVYASRLKNSKNRQNSQLDHYKIADNLLKELNLVDASETKVENASGGERKRLALALELTSAKMPNFILIDEPTSGLDSNSAAIVISTLQSLTQNHPITIVVSIHQPNTELLFMFDQLYALARGFCVYSGAPSGIANHLKQIPKIASTEMTYPIETLIKHSCAENNDSSTVKTLSLLAQKSLMKASVQLEHDTQLVPDGIVPNRARFSLLSVYILIIRYLAYIRGYLWKEWLPFFILYILYGFQLSIFFDSAIALPSGCLNLEDDFNNTCSKSSEELDNEKKMFDNLKYNLFLSNLFIIIVMMQTGLNLMKELSLFFNEHRNGWYSTGSFYLMKAISEIVPLFPLLCFYVYICNIYEPVQPNIYWHLVLVLMLSIVATQAMAYIFFIICNLNLIIAMVTGIGTYLTLILLSNLFISLKNLHYFYQIISFISVPRFTLESLFLLEYGFGRCTSRQIQPVLFWMSLTDDDYAFCITMLIGNLVLYRAVALWMLSSKVNLNENRRQRVKRITDYVDALEKPLSIGLSSSSQDLRLQIKY